MLLGSSVNLTPGWKAESRMSAANSISQMGFPFCSKVSHKYFRTDSHNLTFKLLWLIRIDYINCRILKDWKILCKRKNQTKTKSCKALNNWGKVNRNMVALQKLVSTFFPGEKYTLSVAELLEGWGYKGYFLPWCAIKLLLFCTARRLMNESRNKLACFHSIFHQKVVWSQFTCGV